MEEMQVYDAHEDDTDYSNPPWATIIAAVFLVFCFAAITAWTLTEAVKWLVN